MRAVKNDMGYAFNRNVFDGVQGFAPQPAAPAPVQEVRPAPAKQESANAAQMGAVQGLENAGMAMMGVDPTGGIMSIFSMAQNFEMGAAVLDDRYAGATPAPVTRSADVSPTTFKASESNTTFTMSGLTSRGDKHAFQVRYNRKTDSPSLDDNKHTFVISDLSNAEKYKLGADQRSNTDRAAMKPRKPRSLGLAA